MGNFSAGCGGRDCSTAFSKAVGTQHLIRVCVTGANGFIASHLVQQLLETNRYLVIGTVRSLQNPEKVNHLKALKGANTRLQLVEADLKSGSGFKEAVAGCVCVFHTASPFFTTSSPGREYCEEELIKPAVDGTMCVLTACDEEKSVTHVVLTSSTASVYCRTGKPDTHTFTEDDWSNVQALRKFKDWYALSKTEAEKSAWEFSEKAAFKLVAMNPTLVWGPMLSPHLNTSSETVLAYCDKSKKKYPQGGKTVVDVRDVAKAHIAGFENPHAEGRYLLISAMVPWKDACSHLTTLVPKENVPSKMGGSGAAGFSAVPSNVKFNSSKAGALIGGYISWKDTLTATVTSLAEQDRLGEEVKNKFRLAECA